MAGATLVVWWAWVGIWRSIYRGVRTAAICGRGIVGICDVSGQPSESHQWGLCEGVAPGLRALVKILGQRRGVARCVDEPVIAP